MKTNVRALTRSAVCAALSVVLLYLAALLPSGRLALTAVAGLAAMLVMLACGGKWAIGVYIVSAFLALLLTPSKTCAILYAAFLGYYPAISCQIERVRSQTAQWGIKFVLFNAAVAALFLLSRAILTDALPMKLQAWPLWIVWIGMNAVFLVYDIGLKGLKKIYVRRFVGKGNGVV